jgi:hypothetical protein
MNSIAVVDALPEGRGRGAAGFAAGGCAGAAAFGAGGCAGAGAGACNKVNSRSPNIKRCYYGELLASLRADARLRSTTAIAELESFDA